MSTRTMYFPARLLFNEYNIKLHSRIPSYYFVVYDLTPSPNHRNVSLKNVDKRTESRTNYRRNMILLAENFQFMETRLYLVSRFPHDVGKFLAFNVSPGATSQKISPFPFATIHTNVPIKQPQPIL